MTYEISLTPQAKNDLRNIYEYIAFDLQSPQNAAGQLDRLEKNIVTVVRVMYGGRDAGRQLNRELRREQSGLTPIGITIRPLHFP